MMDWTILDVLLKSEVISVTEEEFIAKTKTMEDYFGKDLNYTQRHMWYNELKYYDSERYEKALKFLCMTSRYRPLLNDVLEAVRNTSKYTEKKASVSCKFCKGTGYIFYKKKIGNNEYDYACLCTCENAVGKEYDGTKIADKEHRNPFYIKAAQEVFGDAIPLNSASSEVSQEKDVKKIVNNLVEQMTF